MRVVSSPNAVEDAKQALRLALGTTPRRPLLFLSSGGSCLKLLDLELVPTDASSWTVSVLDEQYVPTADDRNYFQLVQLPFFGAATERGASSFDPYGGTAKEAGKRFDGFLKQWLSQHPSGRIVATVGIGADAHTMGIVPFDDPMRFEHLFNDTEVLAVGYETEYGDYPTRVTSTFPLLRRAADVIIFAVGREKCDAVQHLFSTDKNTHRFPALTLKRLISATLCTDFSVS